MRFPMRAAFGLALAAGLLVHGQAWAQADTRGLIDRLDRLERDLNTLQGQVYRGGGGSSGGVSGSSAGAGGAGLSGDAYGHLDDRLSALESQLQQLTGQLEKANFAVSQLTAKIDRMQTDDDFRFKELEAKAGTGAAGPGAVPGAVPGAAAPGPASVAPSAGSLGAPPGFLAHQPGSAAATPPAAAPAPGPTPTGAAVVPPPSALAGKTPQEKYDYAFGLLRNSDYDGATRAFQAFIAQNPKDPLAGNAMYWLGQIPFSQGQYEQSAVIFLDAYQKYPKSAKAGESLLKVGLAMSNLGKKKEACAALRRFSTEFPEAADNLRRQAAAEKQKLGC